MSWLELLAAAARAHLDLGNVLALTDDVTIESKADCYDLVQDTGDEDDTVLCSGSLDSCLCFALAAGILKDGAP